eukprot:GHVU01142839.1.p1 GENE.GHVU01142839.1~~GHVU01142839.1.p1  ORF type:complete len:119 (-),score=0.72 GHVU01142839.1:332-688(-)
MPYSRFRSMVGLLLLQHRVRTGNCVPCVLGMEVPIRTIRAHDVEGRLDPPGHRGTPPREAARCETGARKDFVTLLRVAARPVVCLQPSSLSPSLAFSITGHLKQSYRGSPSGDLRDRK